VVKNPNTLCKKGCGKESIYRACAGEKVEQQPFAQRRRKNRPTEKNMNKFNVPADTPLKL